MNLEIRIQNLENWMNSFCIFVKKNFMGIPELKEMIKLNQKAIEITKARLNGGQ